MKVIRLRSQQVEVRAPQELSFDVVAAAGRLVERRSERERVVEFETDFRGRRIVTLELLRLDPPHRIGYEWLEGPLPLVREVISFNSFSHDRTRISYSGEFSAGSGLLRFLLGWLLIRPIYNRVVREHLEMAKQTAEQRAGRSHIHGSS